MVSRRTVAVWKAIPLIGSLAVLLCVPSLVERLPGEPAAVPRPVVRKALEPAARPPASVTRPPAPPAATAGPVAQPAPVAPPVSRMRARPAAGGVPDVALAAYRRAANALTGCGLRWPALAAIGRVESDHGRHGGSWPYADGSVRPPVRGTALDGGADVARITDTDGGRLDQDPVFDRAVGPMQFLPGTWRAHAEDGNGDGSRDPDNLFDAALTAGAYLCAGGGDLGTAAALRAAVYRYNQSGAYVDLVLALADAYGSGTPVTLPARPAPPPPTTPPPPAPPTSAPTTTTTRPSTTPPPETPQTTSPNAPPSTTSTTPSPVTSTPPPPSSTIPITTTTVTTIPATPADTISPDISTSATEGAALPDTEAGG